MDVTLKPDGAAEVNGRQRGDAARRAPEYRRAYQAAATRKATFEQGWAQSFPGLTVNEVTLNDTTRLDEDVKLDYEMACRATRRCCRQGAALLALRQRPRLPAGLRHAGGAPASTWSCRARG